VRFILRKNLNDGSKLINSPASFAMATSFTTNESTDIDTSSLNGTNTSTSISTSASYTCAYSSALLPELDRTPQSFYVRGTFDPTNNDSSSIQFDDMSIIQQDLDALVLHQEFPDATYEECIRFRAKRSLEKAREKMNAYVEWRSLHLLDQIPLNHYCYQTMMIFGNMQYRIPSSVSLM
jgi:hypothetical protein